MQTILGFDCSSKTIGWALLSCDNGSIELVEHGNIKPLNKEKYSIVERLSSVSRDIHAICLRLQPDNIIIEDIIQYMQNKTRANTIITLAVFNRVLALQVYQTTNKIPIFLLPVSIRSKISKFLGIKKIDKEDMPQILQKFFGKTFFIIKGYKQRGKNKGQPIVETYDEADAVAAAWAGLIHLGLTNNRIKLK